MLSGHIHWSFIYYIKVNIGLFILRTRFPANYKKGHVTVSSCLPELICQSQIPGACGAGAERRDIQKGSENGRKEIIRALSCFKFTHREGGGWAHPGAGVGRGREPVSDAPELSARVACWRKAKENLSSV